METVLTVVAMLSMVWAAIMTVATIRLRRAEQRRSDVRIAALASELYPSQSERSQILGSGERPSSQVDLFGTARFQPSDSRLGIVLAVGVVAVVASLGLIVVASRGEQRSTGPAAGSAQKESRAQLADREPWTEPVPL